MIYLDNAATTKPKKRVVDVMMPYLTDNWYNPSSLYSPATEIKRNIEDAREVVANSIGAKSSEIFFTSGGSEANCWAVKGFVNECKADNVVPVIITSAIEHKSILECVKDKGLNAEVYIIGVNKNGLLDLDDLKLTLEEIYEQDIMDCRVLVSVQFANNETGVIQHMAFISKLVHRYNGVLHTDAVQAFGKIDIYVDELGIDMLSASGHKIGAPKGIGFLYKKSDVKIKPLIYGSQMDNLRGGTENVPYIIGFAEATKSIEETDESLIESKAFYMKQKLKSLGCKINGDTLHRLPHIISATFPQDVTAEALIYALDLGGIQVSTGSACDSMSVKPSNTLKAIGLTNEEAMKTIRFSLSEDITYEEIDTVVNEIKKAIQVIEQDWSDEIV